MSAEKQYIPKSRARERDTPFGRYMSVSFSAKELVQFIHAHTNARGYFNITLAPRRNPDETQTHSVYLDTWEPKEKAPLSAAQRAVLAQKNVGTQKEFDDSEPPF